MKQGDFTAEEIEILKSQRLSDDFISEIERVLLTYDDWLLSKWPVIWRGHGIKVLPYMEGEKVVKTIAFVTPPLEWQKVENKMRAILENYIQAYTDTLISYFESQYVGSMEKKRLVQNELEKIESLLFDPNWKGSYSAFGEKLVLTYRNDVPRYDSKLPYWYKKFCVDGGDGLSVIGPTDVTRKAENLERKNNYAHFAASAFAFHRFKKFLNDKLEFETPIVLTFEDWKLGTDNWKDVESEPSKYPINQPFEERPVRREDGQFRKYSLSPVEYKKIATARNDIFEKQVALFLQGQIEDFEQRYSASLEKNTLLEMELQNVNEWLQNKTLSGVYVFPNPNGGTVIFSDIGGILRKDGEDANAFPYWYNRLIVQGKDTSAFIEPKHDKAEALHYPIAVHVLYQYRQFLENRKAKTAAPKEMAHIARLNEKALSYLQILSGHNVHGKKIMSDADFQRLQSYVQLIIEKGSLPDNLEPIREVRFPNAHLRYLFHCIHAELYSRRKIQDHFIDFLHALFPKFTGKKAITKRKFGEQPATWNADLEKMKGG